MHYLGTLCAKSNVNLTLIDGLRSSVRYVSCSNSIFKDAYRLLPKRAGLGNFCFRRRLMMTHYYIF